MGVCLNVIPWGSNPIPWPLHHRKMIRVPVRSKTPFKNTLHTTMFCFPSLLKLEECVCVTYLLTSAERIAERLQIIMNYVTVDAKCTLCSWVWLNTFVWAPQHQHVDNVTWGTIKVNERWQIVSRQESSCIGRYFYIYSEKCAQDRWQVTLI